MGHTKNDRKDHLNEVKNLAWRLSQKLDRSEYFSTGKFRDAAIWIEAAAPTIDDDKVKNYYLNLADGLSKMTLDGTMARLADIIAYIDLASLASPIVARQKDIEKARLIKFCRQMVEAHRHHLFGPTSPRHDLIADLAKALDIVPQDYDRDGFGMQEVKSMTRGV
ncbi:hypothetical protein DWG20_07675 [Crenobacter cavernae]|uniref:Uncharacterized protein n=2 Tax=Crenobacter cavernae TaxID=2290923 RepID=A0A345Y5W6_9NEIS|nr:hypothetical protein DWG20_07675 [Crenobacter cavernae]